MNEAKGSLPYHISASFVPLLFLTVAIVQIWRAVYFDQTPWKGGGFGMFSTVDARSARGIRAYLIRPDGTRIIADLPDSLAKYISKLNAAPSQGKLDVLSARLAGMRWIDERRHFALQLPHMSSAGENAIAAAHALAEWESDPATDVLVGFESVHVELWRYFFDANACTLNAYLSLQASSPRINAIER